MTQNSLAIFSELPDLIQNAISILAIPTSLNENIAEQLLKSSGITNGNTNEVIDEIKSLPVWVKRNRISWSIADDLRDIAVQRLNGKGLNIKRKAVEILKEYEPYFKDKSYLEFKDYQLQITRLLLSIPEEQEKAVVALRSFYEAAEMFNNHEASRVLSSYIDENFKIETNRKEFPAYILSAYFVKGLDSYRKRNFKSALDYLMPVWQKHDNSFASTKDAAIASHFIGLIQSKDRSKLKIAEQAFLQSLEISKEINLIYHIAQVFHSLGNLYIKEKRYSDAEKAFLQSIEMRDPVNDSFGLAQVYHSLGNLYSKDRYRFKEAEKAYLESLRIEKRNNNKYGLAQVYHSLGNLYSKDRHRFKEAEKAYLQSLELRIPANDSFGLAQTHHSLGLLYSRDSARFKDAEKAYINSLDIEKKNNNRYGLALVYRSYGKLMSLTGNYQKAKTYFEESLKYETDSKYIETLRTLIKDLPIR